MEIFDSIEFVIFNFTFDPQVGDFKTYGVEWIKQFPNPENYSTSVKHKLFPKMVACEIKRLALKF